ncbi:MAG: hypothetical protein MJ105_00500 [Lachnospiraceae bacterium]|nr:hypothetical protein [Lachnospiraceae bacterium]
MKISMIEYQGRVDEEGQAVGHAPKVLGDYKALLEKELDIEVFAPKAVLKAAGKKFQGQAKILPRQIVMKGGKSVFLRIREKLGMFKNIRSALKHADGDVLWFFNVEFYLMLYLWLHKKPKKPVVCTLFLDGYHGGTAAKIKQKIFEKAQKKMAYIIATGPQLTFKNVPFQFLPDYGCEEKKYAPYRKTEKNGQTVVLGTMGKEKELEQAVEVFTKLGLPLTLAGRFHDKERLGRLQEMAGENITFRDAYLTEEEYLTLLGESAFVLLPYAPKKYATQTSGVLQEAVFVGTIPVGYETVLRENGVEGITFKDFSNLTKEDFVGDTEKYYEGLRRLRETVYSQNGLQENLIKIFKNIQ